MTKHIGRYEILEEIGHGAMGLIYKANDPLIGRLVAIKTINLNSTELEQEEYKARFYQEAKAAGRLNHPNIVTIFDLGNTGDEAFIAMEYLQGRVLRDILDDRPPIDQVLDIAAQVATGLAYAHENGVIHRDVKPSNIMVTDDGLAKITDFGIASIPVALVRTDTGMVLGSPDYMSPEQVRGLGVDRRSDIFSFGVMLFEMLTGQKPFVSEHLDAIMYQILNSVPPPPSSLNPAVPETLNFIVAKALAKNPPERYQDAHELAADLRGCQSALFHGAAKGSFTPPSRPSVGIADTAPDAAELPMENPDEAKATAFRGLSAAFDSFDATMRLAALTDTTGKMVAELSKTLKMASAGGMAQAALPVRWHIWLLIIVTAFISGGLVRVVAPIFF
jgi:eukaryotic-like serine/threonine-protein kinase